ncbi:MULTISPECIES: hypothetical protein [unclassified Streptomyces]|uniref:hypothetical protein n=1 Tax=unclassified Streptomyces TaxID=2593676 RepID=UPI0015E16968|nr:hypothetical protein [Streptomyces sp. SM10]
MNPDTTTDTGPSGPALPLALVTEPAASAPATPRPAEIRSGDSRKRRGARRRTAAVRG